MLLDDDFLMKEKPNECDFKDWLFRDDDAENLKKWVRYNAVDYGDADKVIKDSSIYGNLGWSSEYIDCIYSFKTYFFGFLRVYLTKLIGEFPSGGYILDNYDSLFEVSERVDRVRDIFKIEEKTSIEFWEELNRFAKNTHTLGNYMPCPDRDYNRIKGYDKGYEYFQDRIDLLYDELKNARHSDHIDQDHRKKYKDWIDSHKEEMLLTSLIEYNEYVCPTIERGRYNVCWIEKPEDLIAYLEYMKNVNALIEERGKEIVLKYSPEIYGKDGTFRV
jgi:hypothetical protein